MSIKLDWLGCATFRLLIDDLTIFLDTYIDRVSAAPNVGISTAEINKADFIFIGHSHYDHIGGADIIAKNTGAEVIGSNESARILIEAGVPRKQLRRAQGGERYRLIDSVTVRVYPSLHSYIWIPNTFRPKTDESQTGHLNLTENERWGPRKPDPLPSGTDPNLIKEIEKHGLMNFLHFVHLWWAQVLVPTRAYSIILSYTSPVWEFAQIRRSKST